LLPNDSVISLTVSLVLTVRLPNCVRYFCYILQLPNRSRCTLWLTNLSQCFCWLLPKQSFTVSELRAYLLLLLPNDSVITLLSLPGTVSNYCCLCASQAVCWYHSAAAYVCCSITLPCCDIVKVRELITWYERCHGHGLRSPQRCVVTITRADIARFDVYS
jgi:hypothetical protein